MTSNQAWPWSLGGFVSMARVCHDSYDVRRVSGLRGECSSVNRIFVVRPSIRVNSTECIVCTVRTAISISFFCTVPSTKGGTDWVLFRARPPRAYFSGNGKTSTSASPLRGGTLLSRGTPPNAHATPALAGNARPTPFSIFAPPGRSTSPHACILLIPTLLYYQYTSAILSRSQPSDYGRSCACGEAEGTGTCGVGG